MPLEKIQVTFTPEDVLHLARPLGIKFTQKDAEDFIAEKGPDVQDAMSNEGSYTIDYFLKEMFPNVNSFVNPGGSKMKHRKRNRHGRFVSNPGFFASPVTYAVGIPALGVLGYFLYKTKVFGLLAKKTTAALPPGGGGQAVITPIPPQRRTVVQTPPSIAGYYY